MPKVDLDAARLARAEQNGDRPVVVLGGREFTLPPSPPAAVLVGIGRLQQGRLEGLEEALGALFGEDLPAVLAAGLAMEDFGAIFESLYGIGVGESPASGG